LQEKFSDRTNPEKGDSFVAFACRILPLCEFWGDMPRPQPNVKKTHDRGVDLASTHPTTRAQHLGQTKFRMREVQDLDGVISKFAAYDRDLAHEGGGAQATMFVDTPKDGPNYVLVTSSDLGEIRRRYEDSRLPSLDFYRKLHEEGRLHLLDGPRLLGTLQQLYRQSFFIASEIDLRLGSEIVHVGSVYLSVVSGNVLRELFEANGSSLFFENIREFLGVGGKSDARGTVNEAITETLRQNPSKMLGRNNGITFRADEVERIGDRMLRLRGGSIVNGCQTTMCVVQAGEAASEAMVVVKVVVGEDSWEVAKSANYQNQVSRIDLELARFLRPQVVRKIAIDLGYGVPAVGEANISIVLEEIHYTKISYDALKLLYIGLFSRYPNNIFDGHYSEVRLDVLNAASARGRQEYVMRVLFQLLMQMKAASEEFKERHRDEGVLDLFKRFFREEQPRYNCLLGLLTACGCVQDDLANADEEVDGALRWVRLERFLGRLEVILVRHKELFNRVFRYAVVALAGPVITAGADRDDMLQRMSREVESSSGLRFPNLVLTLRMHMMNDDSIAAQEIDFGEALTAKPTAIETPPRPGRRRPSERSK
jgi:hypothetical protein